MVRHPIGRAFAPTDMGCLMSLFGADGSADGVVDGSDAAGVAVLVMVVAGSVGKVPGNPQATRVRRVAREGE